MASLIGALRVSLSADTAKFEAGMKRAQVTAASAAGGIQKSMGIIKSGVAGLVAGLSVGMFISAAKNALEYAGSLAEVAQQLGVTARDLQVFRFAAGQLGVSQDQLETGLSKLTITLGKVAAGAAAPAKALSAIGLSADQLRGKDTGEAFRLIADGLQKVTDRSQRAAVEVALFGKAGSMLDNLLSGGSAAVNELSRAAEKLGIVLSDEQIQKADDTADKLEALRTVLSARIAGVVADNADSILGFADSLVILVGKVGEALTALAALRAWFSEAQQLYSIPAQIKRAAGVPVNATQIGQVAQNGGSVTLRLPPAAPPKLKPIAGAGITDFLAGGGSKAKKAGADHSAEDALRNASQFDQELRRAQMDVLRAQQDLAADYVERTTIGIEILDAEKAARDAEHEYQIALYGLAKGKQGQSAAQAAQLKAQEDITDGLEREKLLQDEQEQRVKDLSALAEHDLDRRRDILESQAALATTAEERRKVELEILALAYEQKRLALQSIIDTSKDYREIEDARRDLGNLNATYGNDRQSVIQRTRGPLEDYLASLPTTAAKANEAFQQLQVQGFEGLIDGALQLTKGFDAAKDSLLDTLFSFVQGILKMQLQAGLGSLLKGGSFLGGLLGLGSAAGGLGQSIFPVVNGVDPLAPIPAFAGGGSFSILGRRGRDRNIMSINGLPISRVSHGERVNISAANSNEGGRPYFDLRGAVMTQDLLSQMNQIGAVATGTGAMLGASGGVAAIHQKASRRLP